MKFADYIFYVAGDHGYNVTIADMALIVKVQFQPRETCVFPDCLCIIIHFSASPTTNRARVFCLFAQVCKRKNPISEPSLNLAVILVTSRYEDNTLPVNSEQ